MPENTSQSQVQDQPGGMNDGKIRNKLRRIDQTGKAGEEQMWAVSPGKAVCVVDTHVAGICFFYFEQKMFFVLIFTFQIARVCFFVCFFKENFHLL